MTGANEIQPIGDYVIINMANDICSHPNDIVAGMMPAQAWGPQRGAEFDELVYSDLCPQARD